jgi:DNA recombination-mediator protein A
MGDAGRRVRHAHPGFAELICGRVLLASKPGASQPAGELEGCGGPPPALWLRGTANLRHSAQLTVAVVSARAATSYWQHVASDLSAGLSHLDITVMSVAAHGVAAAALRSALAAGRRTVAVLPCGVDIAFPRRQQSLLDGITEHGVLVSESAPATSRLGSGYVECYQCGTQWSTRAHEASHTLECGGPKGRHAPECECPDHA